MDNLFWPRGCFEICVFDLLGVGCGEPIDEAVEQGEVATVGALDGLLDAVITRDSDRVGSAHVGEVLGGIGLITPFGEPFSERLTAGKHRSKRVRILAASDTREVPEEEGEIDLLGAKQIETLFDQLSW